MGEAAVAERKRNGSRRYGLYPETPGRPDPGGRRRKNQSGKCEKVFAKILEDDVEPLAYMEKEGLLMVSDSGAIEGAVDQVLAENPKTVEEFHSGKRKVLGFLVGQVMKKMRGKADPGMVNELLRKKL